MADYYELLVKEYIEQKGDVVRLNVRFKKEIGGTSDIDVLAFKCDEGKTIVGEVKAATLKEKQTKHEDSDFNDLHLKDKVKELIGSSSFEKCIFCWSVDDETKKYAQDYHGIQITQFPETINDFINKAVSTREKGNWTYDQSYPNIMMLQMLHFFSKPEKGKVRVNLKVA